MIYSDIHIHTKYCDGKNAPEEIVQKAIEMGFESIGFSGHSYTKDDLRFCMDLEDTRKYADEISNLKLKYPQIDILMGIERDFYYTPDNMKYDYIIGSLHYVERDGILLSVDNTEKIFSDNVTKYFDGDYREFVKSYYEKLKDIVKKTNADIIGHFDLVTKFNEGNKFFDENADWYRQYALDALYEIAKTKRVFEVNTGAMSRGYKKTPYPSIFILEEIKRIGCDVIITSDCHNAENLGYACNMAIDYVEAAGFDRVMILTKNGFEYRNI